MKKVANPNANACNKQAMSISKGKMLATIAIDKVRPTASKMWVKTAQMWCVLTQEAKVEQELKSYSWWCHLFFVFLEEAVVAVVEHYAPSHTSKVGEYG